MPKTHCVSCLHLKLLSCRLRKQPTEEEVVQRGMDCILLLMSMYAAAWNNQGADGALLYGTLDGIKRKRDDQGNAEYLKVFSPNDHIAILLPPY